ncbi:MAG TPA: glycine zipper domain-containing protein [Burkholderiales bacterium]|nr:glycine zipper domain-containing protein [Burkholderiales bacterium]
MSKILLASIVLSAAAVAGCSGWGKGETVGTVGGAAAGGAIGSAATGGSTVGTVGGAVLGGAVGNQVGENYDDKHKK